MNCDTALVLKASAADRPVTPMEIDFLDNVALVTYAAGYTAFFDHHDITNCPISSCNLMISDCSAGLTVNANFYQTIPAG